MSGFVFEPARELQVCRECDVLVCGGGIAGVAAALAAARNGAKVLLLEREYALGGLATLGLISVYLPICDGKGRQVSFGIAEELLRLSVKYGTENETLTPWLTGGSDEEKAKRRFSAAYNPQLYAIEMERLLIENGVDILYGTLVCQAVTEGGKITHAVIENKSGRSAVKVKAVVDATGDADVCAAAGEDTVLFKQGNLLAGWYYLFSEGKYKMRPVGFCDIPDSRKTKEQLEEGRKVRRYGGLEAEELSQQVIDSHKMTLDDFFKNGAYDSAAYAPATISTVPQVRMTRRIAGVYTQDDTEMHVEYADSVGLFSDWRKPGPVYELPFSALHGSKVKNLIAAGRCISGTEAMWDINRVIPVCAVSGEAAGTAAAISDDFTETDIAALQARLRNAGMKLHESEL